MKKLIPLYFILASFLFGTANDVKVSQQVSASPAVWADRIFNAESVIGATLASYQSAIGLGTEDSPTFTGLTVSATALSLGYKATSNTTTYAATTTLDMTKNLQTVSLTGNVTFETSNRAAGLYATIRVVCDGTLRNLTFPAWKFVGTVAPANIVASKVAILTLVCFGTAETDIIASWVSEP